MVIKLEYAGEVSARVVYDAGDGVRGVTVFHREPRGYELSSTHDRGEVSVKHDLLYHRCRQSYLRAPYAGPSCAESAIVTKTEYLVSCQLGASEEDVEARPGVRFAPPRCSPRICPRLDLEPQARFSFRVASELPASSNLQAQCISGSILCCTWTPLATTLGPRKPPGTLNA